MFLVHLPGEQARRHAAPGRARVAITRGTDHDEQLTVHAALRRQWLLAPASSHPALCEGSCGRAHHPAHTWRQSCVERPRACKPWSWFTAGWHARARCMHSSLRCGWQVAAARRLLRDGLRIMGQRSHAPGAVSAGKCVQHKLLSASRRRGAACASLLRTVHVPPRQLCSLHAAHWCARFKPTWRTQLARLQPQTRQ